MQLNNVLRHWHGSFLRSKPYTWSVSVIISGLCACLKFHFYVETRGIVTLFEFAKSKNGDHPAPQ